MKEKRRRLGAPTGEYQKNFVKEFFQPLYFYKPSNQGLTAGLSNLSIHSIEVPNLGTFPTLEAAFHAHRDPENKEYVRQQEVTFNPFMSKKLSRVCNLRPDWDEKKDEIMFKLLELKFQQHPELKENLIKTGLRPIIQHSSDSYWGDGLTGKGKNRLGKFLSKLRNKFYLN